MPRRPCVQAQSGALARCPRQQCSRNDLESRAGDKRKLESDYSSGGGSSSYESESSDEEEGSEEDEEEDEDEDEWSDRGSDSDVVEVVRPAAGGTSSLKPQHGGCQSGTNAGPGSDARAVVEAELACSCPQLQRLTVVLLQGYLRAVGLRTSGLKAELINRVQQHHILHAGNPSASHDLLASYPESSFTIDCTGDVCKGDTVLFNQPVFSSFDPVTRQSTVQGYRKVAGRVIKESYGEEKQQHTFSIEVLWSRGTEARRSLEVLLVKGRNLYRVCGGFGARRQPWADESLRHVALQEKHRRGQEARAKRRQRKTGRGGARKQGREAKRRRTDAPSRDVGVKPTVGATRPLLGLGQGHLQLGTLGAQRAWAPDTQGVGPVTLLPARAPFHPWPLGGLPQAHQLQHHQAGLLPGPRMPLQSLKLAMSQPQAPHLQHPRASCERQPAGFGVLDGASFGGGRGASNMGRGAGKQAAAGHGHKVAAAGGGGCHATAGTRSCRCGGTAALACAHALCAFCCTGGDCPRHAAGASLQRGNRRPKSRR